MTKFPEPIICYTKTNLTKVEFDKPQKSWVPKMKYIGKLIFFIIQKQEELYGPNGSDWIKRYMYEITQRGTSLKDAEQYIKKGN